MATVKETTVPQTRTFDILGLTEEEMEVLHSLLGQTSMERLNLPPSSPVQDLFYAVHGPLRGRGNSIAKHPLRIAKLDRG